MNVTLHLAWRNIWRHKRRTWLTVSGIAFSAFLFVFFVPLQYGTYDLWIDISLRSFTGYAQVQRPGYQQRAQIHNTIDGAEQLSQQLRSSGDYQAVGIRASGFALISSDKRSYGAQIVGVQSEYEPELSYIPKRIVEGRYLRDRSNELVIGAALARNLKLKVGDEVTLLGNGKDGSIAAAIIPVVGIFESGDNSLDRFIAQTPLENFQSIFSMGDSAHTIVVLGRTMSELEILPKHLEEAIAGRDDLVVLDWTHLVPGIKQAMELDKVSGLIFLFIMVAIVVFSIFNTFLMSVLERTREFGLMLALGASPRNISRLVMLESLLLTLLGLVMGTSSGVLLDWYYMEEGFTFFGMTEIYEQYNIPITALYPKLSLFTIFLGPVVILLSTNIAAWIPLRRIHRLKPTEAMRTV